MKDLLVLLGCGAGSIGTATTSAWAAGFLSAMLLVYAVSQKRSVQSKRISDIGKSRR